jgi:hypothetical protein
VQATDGILSSGRSCSNSLSVIPQDSRPADVSFMLLTQKLLAWLIIGNTSPFTLPFPECEVDELSVEIGQAT